MTCLVLSWVKGENCPCDEDTFNVMVLRGVDSVVFILPPRRHPLSHLELMSKDQSSMEGKLGVSGTDL